MILLNIQYIHHTYTEHCAACSNQTQTARVYQNADSSLRKHEDLNQCCFNIGQAPLVGGGGNIETALGQILVFAGLHTGVCLHPPLPSIIFSPADDCMYFQLVKSDSDYGATVSHTF